MLTLTLSVLGFALLFAVYGVTQRLRPTCSSNCGACENACASQEQEHT